MDKLVEQLKELKSIKPRKDWVEKNKEQLISQIEAQAPQKQSFFFSYWYLIKMLFPIRLLDFIAKPVGIVTMVALLIVCSGAYSVNASKGSIPGDTLYPVKTTSEKVHVGLTVSKERKTELHMDFAEERVNEIDKIIQVEPDPVKKKQKIEVATTKLKQDLDNVNNNLEEVKTTKQEKEKTQKTMEVVKKVDEKSEEISTRLAGQKEQLKEDKEVAANIGDVVKSVDETGVKAVEVIVDKYDKGEAEISSEEVVETVKKQLEKTEKKINEMEDKAKEVEGLEAEEESLEEEIVEEVVEEEASQEESAQGENQEEEIAPEQISQEPADPQAAKDKLAQAQDLLDQGDVVNAIEKVKEANDITAQVESDIVEKNNSLQTENVEENIEQSSEPEVSVDEAVEDVEEEEVSDEEVN